jgi:DNA polymerase-3 subunit beta
MNIKTTKEDILPGLSIIGGVVERRQTLPILGNILFQVESDKAMLTATDLEMEISVNVDVQSAGPAEFTIPARKFIDICKALPDGSAISLDVGSDKATIVSGRSRFAVGILPAMDFPSLNSGVQKTCFDIPVESLKSLLDRTAFSMAHQDVRYYLNGLLVELAPSRLRTVATDGHRLALAELQLTTSVDETITVILPRKAVLELSRVLGQFHEDVEICISDGFARFRSGTSVFTTKLIDGRFPDYDRVIPIDNDTIALVDREGFRNALHRSSILSSEKYKGVRLEFEPDNLKLQAHNPEQEESQDELEIEYQGNVQRVGFNVTYLLDILSVLQSDRIRVFLGDAGKSALLKDGDDDSALFVIMPMRL